MTECRRSQGWGKENYFQTKNFMNKNILKHMLSQFASEFSLCLLKKKQLKKKNLCDSKIISIPNHD